MAIVFDGPVTPDAQTVFIRNVPTPAEFSLSDLLPDRYFNRNTIDLSEITRTNRTARFRAYDGRLHVSERDAGVTKQVKLPPLSTSLSMGELERLQLEFSRNAGGDTSQVVNAIYDDSTNLTREVQARMEQARGDVLTDGKFTLAGEGGLFLEADYGVPGGHIVAPGTLWTNTGAATIIANETTWTDTYVATNGFAPGGQVVSRRVLNLMLQNSEIRTLAASMSGTPGLVTRPALDGALQAFGLPPIVKVYDTVVDVDGRSPTTGSSSSRRTSPTWGTPRGVSPRPRWSWSTPPPWTSRSTRPPASSASSRRSARRTASSSSSTRSACRSCPTRAC
jgi:hypothetical protein